MLVDFLFCCNFEIGIAKKFLHLHEPIFSQLSFLFKSTIGYLIDFSHLGILVVSNVNNRSTHSVSTRLWVTLIYTDPPSMVMLSIFLLCQQNYTMEVFCPFPLFSLCVLSFHRNLKNSFYVAITPWSGLLIFPVLKNAVTHLRKEIIESGLVFKLK